MSAQTRQIALAKSLPRAIAAAASWQMAAQSMSSAMQRAIIFTSGSFRQALAQWLHAMAQALQASMQAAWVGFMAGTPSGKRALCHRRRPGGCRTPVENAQPPSRDAFAQIHRIVPDEHTRAAPRRTIDAAPHMGRSPTAMPQRPLDEASTRLAAARTTEGGWH
jgi:hypothetical protein